MRVELDYFKNNGKYYTSGSYDTDLEDLTDIWSEIRSMGERQVLPGLHIGHSEVIVSVDVPNHSYNHPKLII